MGGLDFSEMSEFDPSVCVLGGGVSIIFKMSEIQKKNLNYLGRGEGVRPNFFVYLF